jgi:hydroxymethylglutaryl-CoA synthase
VGEEGGHTPTSCLVFIFFDFPAFEMFPGGKAAGSFGICGMEVQFPSLYIDQEEMEESFGIPKGKVTMGLVSKQMGICSADEDVVSLSMGALSKLLRRYKVGSKRVSRIEVGSESHFDGSKSIKSYLMDLFKENEYIGGADVVSACYGGTAALLNTIGWMESSMYDGNYAIVICADIAMYNDSPSLPTGGGGAVALLLGPDAPVVLVGESLVNYSRHVYDFWKPKETYPFPVVDGKVSIECYLEALKKCYSRAEARFDFLCCHAPFAKLPLKAAKSLGVSDELVSPSLTISMRNGNAYTGSLYMALLSLLNSPELKAKAREGPVSVLMFSYGSGLTSSMFTLRVESAEAFQMDLGERLDERAKVGASEYLTFLKERVELGNGFVSEGNTPNRIAEISGYKRRYFQQEI